MYPLCLRVSIKGYAKYKLVKVEFQVTILKAAVEVYIKCVGREWAREAGVKVYDPEVYKNMLPISY